MKERILIGTEQQIRFRLDGNKDNDVIYDITRPLGRFLIDFEYDKYTEIVDRDETLESFRGKLNWYPEVVC